MPEVVNSITVPFLALLSAIVAAFGTYVTTRWTEQRRADAAKEVVDVAARVEQARIDQIEAPESVLDGWRELFATEREAMSAERKRWLEESRAQREAWEDRLAALEEKVMRMQQKLDVKDAEIARRDDELAQCHETIGQLNEAIRHRDEAILRERAKIHELRVIRAAEEALLAQNNIPIPSMPTEPIPVETHP